MPAPSWLGDAISGSIGLLTTAFTANQTKQLAKGQANIVESQNASALAIAREQTLQAQLALEAAKAQSSKSSGNTTLYILLGVGGVAVLGFVAYLVTKK